MGITDLQNAQGYIPQVTCYGYVRTHVSQPLSSVTVRLYNSIGTLLVSTTTNSQGYYTLSYGSDGLGESLKLQITKTGYETQYVYVSDNGNFNRNFYTAPTNVKKIAVFFYATDATTYSYVSAWGNQLKNEEDFTSVIYYENPTDWQSTIRNNIAPLEDGNTLLFLYFCAHGDYDSVNSNSYMRIRHVWVWDLWPFFGHYDDKYIYSNTLNTELDTYIESGNVFVVIESCHSGGFVDDLTEAGVFVISTTDYNNLAYCMGPVPNQGIFSYYFFNRIHNNYGDYSSYSYARTQAISLHSDQNPMYNDQIPYEWFKWW